MKYPGKHGELCCALAGSNFSMARYIYRQYVAFKEKRNKPPPTVLLTQNLKISSPSSVCAIEEKRKYSDNTSNKIGEIRSCATAIILLFLHVLKEICQQ